MPSAHVMEQTIGLWRRWEFQGLTRAKKKQTESKGDMENHQERRKMGVYNFHRSKLKSKETGKWLTNLREKIKKRRTGKNQSSAWGGKDSRVPNIAVKTNRQLVHPVPARTTTFGSRRR